MREGAIALSEVELCLPVNLNLEKFMTSTNPLDWKNHQVDHLFLLVGENPLPNYVAARLLIEPKTSIVYLVQTTATAGKDKPADLLEKELKKHNITTKPISLGDAESDGDKIRAKIKDAIQPKGKPPLQGRIGLNYTGGTKAMAVHAYQAFKELQLTDPVFSYLDSRKLAMHIDGKDNPIPVDLALSPVPTLETILGLHNLGWKENNRPIPKSMFPEEAAAFVKLHKNSGEVFEVWKKWLQKVIQKGQDQKNKCWKDDNELESKLPIFIETKKSETIEIPQEIREILNSQLKWKSKDNKIDIQVVKDETGFKLSQIYEWFNNGWLEDYVMSQVENIASKYQIQEIKRSLHIQDPKDLSRVQDQFEFDVAFLRGYQLFGISCTTSANYKECKQKLFEAQLRATQIGGDEARIALVCFCKPNPNEPNTKPSEKLKKELNLFIKYNKIEVFDYQDLEPEKFAKKLDFWILRRNT